VIVSVDADSRVPPFEQLRAQISTLIQAGSLVPGARLPSIRQLAKDLGIATGTAARAYAELEREGLVVARGRHGTVVAPAATTPAVAERERRRLLDAAASTFAAEARRLGVGVSDAQAAVRAALDA
jgi:DNA-binding transcriptional regulator YhcF (GntR family)